LGDPRQIGWSTSVRLVQHSDRALQQYAPDAYIVLDITHLFDHVRPKGLISVHKLNAESKAFGGRTPPNYFASRFS
jgi:hypothetical protein